MHPTIHVQHDAAQAIW